MTCHRMPHWIVVVHAGRHASIQHLLQDQVMVDWSDVKDEQLVISEAHRKKDCSLRTASMC